MDAEESSKKKKDKEKVMEKIEKLRSELAKQEEHVSDVMKRIQKEKDRWLETCAISS